MNSVSRLFIFILFFVTVLGCRQEVKKIATIENSTNEWIELFNKKDLTDWTVKINRHPINYNIHNTFRVEDGLLKVSYDGYDEFGTSYGHIFYKNPFSNYKLKFQYRFVGNQVKDGKPWAKKNSGVMIHAQSPESMGLDQGFPVSLEAQFLGGVEEGIERQTGSLCTPGTNVVMRDSLITKHCIISSSETFYGEEWIEMEVHVYNDSLISHLINGKEVIRYSKPTWGGDYTPDTEVWRFKDGKPLKSGYIAFQSESHPIEFRNIKLLNLDDEPIKE
jgi:hypothetical protein